MGKIKETFQDAVLIGTLAYFGSYALGGANATAAASGGYASLNDMIREKSGNNGKNSYNTRSIWRSTIPGIGAITASAMSSPAQTTSEYALDIGATTAFYIGTFLLSPIIRKGPGMVRKIGKSLIDHMSSSDTGEEKFIVEDKDE
jgi:hypothetical protein